MTPSVLVPDWPGHVVECLLAECLRFRTGKSAHCPTSRRRLLLCCSRSTRNQTAEQTFLAFALQGCGLIVKSLR